MTQIVIRNYQLGEELGRGTFGVTYYGYDYINGREVAIKTIDINKSTSLGANMNEINQEIDTLKEISSGSCSEYVACYYESFQETFNGVPTIFIVSEYISGGSLAKFIQNGQGNIPPTILWPIYLQLILGLIFIHEKGFAHRDIKPDNILITTDYTIKYIDFGLACLQRCSLVACNNTCIGNPGTITYEPPEYFTHKNEESLDGSKAHDVWSLAVVMFELANGYNNYPFQVISSDGSRYLPKEEVYRNIASAPQFSSNYLLDDGRTNIFLNSILVNDWRLRPTIQQLESIFINYVLSRVLIQ